MDEIIREKEDQDIVPLSLDTYDLRVQGPLETVSLVASVVCRPSTSMKNEICKIVAAEVRPHKSGRRIFRHT